MTAIAFFCLWCLVFTIPVENMVVMEGVGTISRLTGVVSVVTAICAMLIDKKYLKLNVFHFVMLFFLLYCTSTYFWTIDNEATIRSIKTLWQLYVLILIINFLVFDESKVKRIYMAYVCGCFLSLSSILYTYVNNLEAFYQRFSAKGFDPNDLGLILAIGVPMAWYVAVNSKSMWLKIIFASYVPLGVFCIILTASRGAFLALAVALVYLFLSIRQASVRVRWASYFFIVLILFFIFQNAPESSLNRLSTITSELSSGDLNARRGIWVTGLEIFSNNPVFGVGFGAFSSAMAEYYGYEVAAHSLFLSLLVGQGLVGLFIFFVLVLVLVCKVVSRSFKEKNLWTIMLLTIFVGTLSLSWELRKPVWLLFGILTSMAYSNDGKFHKRIQVS